MSTTVETSDPDGELTPGLDLLAPIKEKYECQNILSLSILTAIFQVDLG